MSRRLAYICRGDVVICSKIEERGRKGKGSKATRRNEWWWCGRPSCRRLVRSGVVVTVDGNNEAMCMMHRKGKITKDETMSTGRLAALELDAPGRTRLSCS